MASTLQVLLDKRSLPTSEEISISLDVVQALNYLIFRRTRIRLFIEMLMCTVLVSSFSRCLHVDGSGISGSRSQMVAARSRREGETKNSELEQPVLKRILSGPL
ncbi:hypothetical protein pdam_00015840 [Pocillopora damicornis]|uniref:Uncharacterized protein n=1 Tax=Pocillopora damicornis TaxID=46731 RepID=A0A3M6T5Q4_POCDA|nr:hypothetical protein pdam_00015840 [Pocillopora damicornis]